jgi:hypothetical protein
MSHAGRSILVALGLVVASAAAVAAQSSLPPMGASRPADTLDTLRESVTRPLPALPAAPRPGPPAIWVPDRHVNVPGVPGLVHVPGHWERTVGPSEVRVPPLVGVAPDGTTVYFPGGVAPHPDRRESP